MAYLKDCSEDQRRHLLDRLSMELEVDNFEELNNLMLNWEEIKEMSKNGISFGAHTVNHPIISKIPLDMAEKEILQSKQTIEKMIDQPVTGFAYPFGKEAQYNPNIFPILKKLKFKFAVTTETDVNRYDTKIYALNRSGPWELSLIK